MGNQNSKQVTLSTYQVHKRQIVWQVFLPIILTAVIFLAAGVMAGMGTFNNPANGTRWTGIAIIWLIIPAIVAGAIFLLVIGLICYGLAKLLNITPLYSLIARTYVYKFAYFVRQWSDKAAEPVIIPKIAWAGLRGFFESMRDIFRIIFNDLFR